MKQEIINRIISVIKDTIEKSDIVLDKDSDLTASGIDSLQVVRIMIAIEQEFNLELDESALFEVSTVNDLAKLIEKKSSTFA